MAKVQFSALVDSIRGKVNGDAIVSSPYGHYLKRAPKPKARYSTDALTVRAAFRYLSDRWKNDLTDTQRAWWEFVSTINPFTDAFGNEYFVPGRQLYIRQNIHDAIFGNYSLINDSSSGDLSVAVPSYTFAYDSTYGIWCTSGGGYPVTGYLSYFRVSVPVDLTRNSWPNRTCSSRAVSGTSMNSPTALLCFICPLSVMQRYVYPARFFIRARFCTASGQLSPLFESYIDISSL